MELLTEKCKSDFEKWYTKDITVCLKNREYKYLLKSRFSMQYGVLVDFFDSVGIYSEIQYFNESKIYFESSVMYNGWNHAGDLSTRSEARKQVIIKANELYNKQHG